MPGALGFAGRAECGSRQFSRGVAGVVLAGSGKGELVPEIDVGRRWLRLGGLLVLGFAAGTARAARLAVELPIRPAGHLLGSLASGAPLPQVPVAPLASFSLDSLLALAFAAGFAGDSVAAIHRVSGACHVIVARVAAEHALPDCRGHTLCPTLGIFPDSSGNCVEFREARTFAVSDLRALLHIITPPDKPPPHRASSVPVLPRSSAAPRCQSAASRRPANAAAARPPPAPSSP